MGTVSRRTQLRSTLGCCAIALALLWSLLASVGTGCRLTLPELTASVEPGGHVAFLLEPQWQQRPIQLTFHSGIPDFVAWPGIYREPIVASAMPASTRWSVVFPGWNIVLVLTTSGLSLFIRGRSATRTRTRCSCGYSLLELTGQRCPECGRIAPSARGRGSACADQD